jgi:anthranilate synthase/aminodeoxychorismate synthase-like glutamine amidotransferase
MSRHILMIDNLDSFTFNLVESFERLGCDVQVYRHNVAAADALDRALEKNSLIVLSPGPGTPDDAGCCLELISLAKGKAPLLGVCLGHQALVQEAGGTVCRAPEPVHGKSIVVPHDGQGPFRGLDGPMHIGRYHSLCTPNPPSNFVVHAEYDGMAMAISDAKALQTGLQFHPESILTPHGDQMLRNVIEGV